MNHNKVYSEFSINQRQVYQTSGGQVASLSVIQNEPLFLFFSRALSSSRFVVWQSMIRFCSVGLFSNFLITNDLVATTASVEEVGGVSSADGTGPV